MFAEHSEKPHAMICFGILYFYCCFSFLLNVSVILILSLSHIPSSIFVVYDWNSMKKIYNVPKPHWRFFKKFLVLSMVQKPILFVKSNENHHIFRFTQETPLLMKVAHFCCTFLIRESYFIDGFGFVCRAYFAFFYRTPVGVGSTV